MYSYETVSESLTDLKKRGFATDFNLAFDNVKCAESGVCLSPSQFEIVEFYRFEGNTDPGDEAVVYAIASKDNSMKGVLVSAYGMYSEQVSNEMIKKLSMQS